MENEEYILPEYIKDEVQSYKEETTDFMDSVKWLFFVGLLYGTSIKEFDNQMKKEYQIYKSKTDKRSSKAFKKVEKLVSDMNSGQVSKLSSKPIEHALDELEDMFSKRKAIYKNADDIYMKRIKNYYKTSSETLKKEYISAKDYLAEKVSKFDKVEKTVAYRNADGSIKSYQDISTYDSMKFNTDLRQNAWDETIRNAREKGNDLVYVYAHPFACPLCQEWHGKKYSLTGATPGVPLLQTAYDGGLGHPNCAHQITEYHGEPNDTSYSSEEWTEKYKLKQKKQSLELKRTRLKNDRKIYKELGSQKDIDEINKKIQKLNKKIKETNAQM